MSAALPTEGHQRSTTPQSAVSQPPKFSVVAWEKSSVLPEVQLKLIAELATSTIDRPLPTGFGKDKEQDASETSAPITTMAQLEAWMKSFSPGATEATLPTAALQSTSQQLSKLKEYKAYCDSLVAEVEAALKHLTAIDDTYTVVAKKTSELHHLCEGLLAEERQLQYFAEELRSTLSHFEDIESISSKFNSPTLSVEDEHFLALLKRLDDSVSFLQQNPSFMESQAYLFKFRQLQSRGLTLIRDFVVNSLKQISHQLQIELKPAIPPQAKPETASSGQELTVTMNVRFASAAPRIQALCREVETRASARDYALLLSDIQYCYFQVRKTLLQDIVSKQLMTLMKANDLFATVRAGSFYLSGLCEVEYDLHSKFFAHPSSALKMLIEWYSTVMYDAVRPVLVRSKDVNLLCTLVRILNEEILQRLLAPKGLPVQAFIPIIQRLIEDAQDRLIFVTEMYIRDEIQSYELTLKVINYPDNLSAPPPAETPPPSPSLGQAAKTLAPAVSKSKFHGWYPTLELTVKLLAELYLALDSGPFNGLAREATLACAQTLCTAARLIEKKNKIDSQLFLIKHMCLLNDETKPFKIDFFITEQTLDFSHIYGLFRRVMNGELALSSVFALSSNNAIYSLLTSAAPKLAKSEKDLKKDMDALLSQTMESFIVSVARIVTEKLLSFLTQASAHVNGRRQRLQSATSAPNSAADAPLWQQPFATKEALVTLIKEALQSFNTVIPTFAARLTLYLENHPTKFALFTSIRQTILDTLENFNALVRREYPPEEILQVTLFSIEDIMQLLDRSIQSPGRPTASVGGPSTPKAPHRATSPSPNLASAATSPSK